MGSCSRPALLVGWGQGSRYSSAVDPENVSIWNVLNPEAAGQRFPHILVLNSRLCAVGKREVVVGTWEQRWAGGVAHRGHREASVLAVLGSYEPWGCLVAEALRAAVGREGIRSAERCANPSQQEQHWGQRGHGCCGVRQKAEGRVRGDQVPLL